MKPSLNSKILVASLSALIVIGSGCERRGRAPVAAKTVEEKKEPAPDSTPVVSTGDETEKKPEIREREDDLEAKAQMITADNKPCTAPAIDVTASLSKRDAIADIQALGEFKKCMTASGIRFLEGDQKYTLDAKPSNTDGKPLSAAQLEFERLSVAGFNDEEAEAIMEARLNLSMSRFDSFVTKYGEDRLRSADVTATSVLTVGQTMTTINTELEILEKSNVALEAGRKDIKALRTVENGADLKN